METFPVTCRTLETFYHINAHTFEKQYKETLSGFRDWNQLDHAGKPYAPFRFSNGDTRPELLVRSRYLLFKSADKWTEKTKGKG